MGWANIYGLLDDGHVRLDPGDEMWASWRQKSGPTVRCLMSFWDTKRRFGLLACHILHSVWARIGPSHGATGLQYGIDQYSPAEAYFKADMQGNLATHLCWPMVHALPQLGKRRLKNSRTQA